MKFKKKYIIYASVIGIVMVINFLSTLRLFFTIAFPEREIREVITEFFKNNLNKAVKCNEVFIDYNGNIILIGFDVSITNDFNDNISFIKCKKGVIDLDFFNLLGGRITIRGLRFYNAEITFPKKYGRSHIESLYQIIDLSKFFTRVRDAYAQLHIEFKRATVYYKESLRGKQASIELYKIDAEINIEKNSVDYYADGSIRSHKTERIRNGSFYCKGNFDSRGANPSSIRLKIDNFDLTYLNDYIAEYKLADISVFGGASCDLEFRAGDGRRSLKGRLEANSLTVTDRANKFNIVSDENLNADIDIKQDAALNSYTVSKLNLYDDVCTVNASGRYVSNKNDERIIIHYGTNKIDLSDLSQILTPYYNMRYTGTVESDGTLFLDLKNNSAAGTKIGLVVDKFTLVTNEKGNDKTIIDESNMSIRLTESEMSIRILLKPLNSDLLMKGTTRISSWSPFKSDTTMIVGSQRLNLSVLYHSIIYTLNKIFASAYNKKISDDTVPFLQKPAGKFLNDNRIALTAKFDSIFSGRKRKLSDLTFDLQLNRGILALGNFSVQGCGAGYALSAQAYFNSDRPYIKLEGGVHDMDLAELYGGTGARGFISGTAGLDFRYELSANSLSDILENSKGSLNLHITNGVLQHTMFQNTLRKFLRKNGYPSDSIGTINFESITVSMSQTGENFWFSNFRIQGDTLSFNGAGDYTYPGGLSSRGGITVKREESSSSIPLRLYGPLLSPCIEVYDKKDAQKTCF